MDELLLLLRRYNLPACSVTEGTQVDEARRDFLARAEPLIRKDERERIFDYIRRNCTTTIPNQGYLVLERDLKTLKGE